MFKRKTDTPELRAALASQGISSEIEVSGNLGKTLRPDNEQGLFPNYGERALSNFIEVYTSNVGTSFLEQVQNAGHELFGHALLYLRGLDPRHGGANNEDLNNIESQVANDIQKYNPQ